MLPMNGICFAECIYHARERRQAQPLPAVPTSRGQANRKERALSTGAVAAIGVRRVEALVQRLDSTPSRRTASTSSAITSRATASASSLGMPGLILGSYSVLRALLAEYRGLDHIRVGIKAESLGGLLDDAVPQKGLPVGARDQGQRFADPSILRRSEND